MTRSLLAIGFVLLSVSASSAQTLRHPDSSLHYVYPAGARIGSTIEVELGGMDGLLEANAVLVEGAPGVTVRDVRPSKTNRYGAVQATFVVATDAPVGKRLVRVQGGSCGLTNSRPFFVGRLPEMMEKLGNDTPETAQEVTLPAVINAQINPTADFDCYAFRGRAGQKLVAAVLAHGMDTLLRGGRLNGFLDTSLELLDDKGRIIASAEDSLGLDPILTHTLPADGRYVVRVQSVFFKGAPSAVYRLTLGEVPYPTHVFPPGGQRGQKVELDLGGIKQSLTIPADAHTWYGVAFDHPLSDGRDLPFVCGSLPERVESEPKDRNNAVALTLPSVINGRINKAGAEAWYCVTLKKGQGIVIEVTAQRHLRSSIDSHVRVFNAAGQMLAENDDGALFAHPNQCAHDFSSADSWLLFTAPADGDYSICLSDKGNAFGTQAVYRLSVSELKPDFALWQWPDAVPVWGPGTSASFVVHLQYWGGFKSDVQLRIDGLPPGWTGSVATMTFNYFGVFVPPYGAQMLMTITAPKDAKPGTVAAFRVVGRADQDGQVIEHVAQALTLYGSSHTDRMHLRFSPTARAVVAPPLDCWIEPKVQELSVRIGETVEVPVRVHRKPGVKADLSIGIDGPINGGAAGCAWRTPLALKADQDEVKVPLTISPERKPGTYHIVVSRSWAADLRAGRPGPCTPLIRLNILPADKKRGAIERHPTTLLAGLLLVNTYQAEDEETENVRSMIARLRHKNPAERAAATREIALLGPKNPKAVSVLIGSLDDESEFVRQSATGALTRIGKTAVPELTEALGSTKRWTRRQATLALAHIGMDAKPAAPLLTKLLRDPENDIRAFAALALVKIDPSNTETIPLVIKGLDVPEKELRISTLFILEQVGLQSKEVPGAFSKALRDSDKEVRITAASILARAGETAKSLTPDLIKALKDTELSVRISVASALASIDADKGKPAVVVLLEALKDGEAENRRSAVFVLGQFGDKARDALPNLRQLEKDSSVEVRQAAATAIRQIAGKP